MTMSARQGCSQQKLETASLRRCWGQASLPRMVLHQAGGRLTKGSRWWTWHYCCNAVVTPRIRVPHLKVSLLLCGFGSCDTCMRWVKLNPQIVKPLVSVMVAAVFFRCLVMWPRLSWTHHLPTSDATTGLHHDALLVFESLYFDRYLNEVGWDIAWFVFTLQNT